MADKSKKVSSEIERSYLVSQADGDWMVTGKEGTQIVQGYLAVEKCDEGTREVRVRKKTKPDGSVKCTLTVKYDTAGGTKLDRKEAEAEIPLEAFEALIATTKRVVRKTRYEFDCRQGTAGAPLTIELDKLDITVGSGLVEVEPMYMAEVEFGSLEEAEAFVEPLWFGPEVTDERWARNASLAENPLTFIEGDELAHESFGRAEHVERCRKVLEQHLGYVDLPKHVKYSLVSERNLIPGGRGECYAPPLYLSYRSLGGYVAFYDSERTVVVETCLPSHSHPDADEEFLVAHGSATARIDGEVLNCVAGDLLKVPAGAVHSLEPDRRHSGVDGSDLHLCRTFVLEGGTREKRTEFVDKGLGFFNAAPSGEWEE